MAIQNKRVHFPESPYLKVVKFIEPEPLSPTWSDSSLPDSDSGPSTPPSTSTFASRPLHSAHYEQPEESKASTSAHPLLFDARTNTSPLAWNAELPTHYAAVSVAGRKGKGRDLSILHPSDLDAAATSPAVTSIDIHLPQLPPFWKPIQLRRSPDARDSPITIGEVLEATHHHLQTRMSEKEFHKAPEDVRRKIQHSVHRRLDAARRNGDRALLAALEHAGILRVDALGGVTEFAAFIPMSQAGDSWSIIFRPVHL